MASSMDEDSNSEAKNHNINPVGFAELEAVSFQFDIYILIYQKSGNSTRIWRVFYELWIVYENLNLLRQNFMKNSSNQCFRFDTFIIMYKKW